MSISCLFKRLSSNKSLLFKKVRIRDDSRRHFSISWWLPESSTDGVGSTYNPKRREALELIKIRETLEAVIDDIRKNSDNEENPRTVVTSARDKSANLSFSVFCELLKNRVPYLLVLGTAWGLSESIITAADFVLEPVKGSTDYNHLPVRSAAAIILDRVLGQNK